jgi:Pep3/Vps18/deep orange family
VKQDNREEIKQSEEERVYSELPYSFAITQIHIVLMYSDTIVIYSKISKQIVHGVTLTS